MCEIMKKEKGICASFAVVPEAAKVIATCIKCLVKTKEAFFKREGIFKRIIHIMFITV